MIRFCINRHDGYVNGVFLDCSVRKVGLKELWKLKWNRKFDLDGGPPPEEFDSLAPWMSRFKDYY
jgi:prepilin-type processing-associated H-X9-DG protein